MARGSRRQRPATAFGTAAAATLPAFAQRKEVVRGAISAISRKENSYSRLPPDYPPNRSARRACSAAAHEM